MAWKWECCEMKESAIFELTTNFLKEELIRLTLIQNISQKDIGLSTTIVFEAKKKLK